MQSQSSSGTATPGLSQQPTLVATANGGSSSLPGDALSNAVKKFKNRLSGQHLIDFKNTTYDSLCSDINAMQDSQHKRKEIMNMGRIQTFLEAMNQFGKVVEIFLNVSEAVAFIWGPMKFLLLVPLPSRYCLFPNPLTHVDSKYIF
jgi:hypothetical protein